MTTSPWAALREALAHANARFADLLDDVKDPGAPAVGTWNVGEVVAHVREVTALNSLFAFDQDPPHELRALHAKAREVSIDMVAELNELALSVWVERSPRRLAAGIHAQVSLLLDGTSDAHGDERIAWLGGMKVPLKLLFAHTLSELFVHGNDIARAEGRVFPLPASQAKLIFELFLFELLRSPDVANFAAARATAAQPVTCELRLREASPVLLVTHEGAVAVDEPGRRRPIDVRISADPGAMWLVMNHRMSPLRASLDRAVIVWGRRPWRLRRLTQVLRPA